MDISPGFLSIMWIHSVEIRPNSTSTTVAVPPASASFLSTISWISIPSIKNEIFVRIEGIKETVASA